MISVVCGSAPLVARHQSQLVRERRRRSKSSQNMRGSSIRSMAARFEDKSFIVVGEVSG
jgi:hypothetical protein